MDRLAAEKGLGLNIAILPTKGEVYPWIIERRAMRPTDEQPSGFALAVLGACERAGLRCLDTKPYLVREARRLFESSGRMLWWRDDTHLGECGHEAVARFIAEQMLDVRDRGAQVESACPVSVTPAEAGGKPGSGFRLPPE